VIGVTAFGAVVRIEQVLTSNLKSLSPNHRFVIALHSLDGVVESGLRVCPPEKKAVKLGCAVQRDTFSGPV